MASQPPHQPLPPPPLEVRCAGCDETLEVEPGLMEFICPDCHTPQALPPELLPRKRKALPLPRAVDSGKTQLPCACCSTVLNVPHGLFRFACPICGTELGVDHERLKAYLTGSSAAVAAREVTAVTPSAVRLPQPLEVQPHMANDAITPTTTAPVASTVYVEKDQITAASREPVSSINVNSINAITPSRTPALTRVNVEQNKTLTLRKETGPTSVNAEQAEAELALTPPKTVSISSRSKRGRKQASLAAATSSPSLYEAEPSVRRSKRLAKSPAVPDTIKQTPKSKRKEQKNVVFSPCQSQSSQTEQAESQLEPQDIAMHYNELFPMDIGKLFAESPVLQIDPHSDPSSDLRLEPDSEPCQDVDMVPAATVSDDEEDETYVAEPDCGANSSNDKLDKSKPWPAALKTLRCAQKRNGSHGKGQESKHRGPTRCLQVWNRPDNDPIEVDFNHLGQPIGKESSTLKNFLGTIARDGNLTPLNFIDWRSVPTDYKDTIWLIVKSKFKLQPIRKKYIIKATGRIWTNWKSNLKRLHYDIHDNDEARLADIDGRILPEHWPFLVHFWSSEEGQKRSAIGRESRKKVKAMHTLGTKSYARLREEERLKRPNKEEPNQAEIFILTRTRKDGTPVNEESAQIIARLREELKEEEPSNSSNPQNDILAKVLGKKKGGCMLTFGLLPNKPDLLSSGGPSSEKKESIVAEARRLVDEESKPLRKKMEAMEKRHKEMEEEMERMRSTIALMHNMFSKQDHLQNQPGLSSGICGDK